MNLSLTGKEFIHDQLVEINQSVTRALPESSSRHAESALRFSSKIQM